MTYRNLVEIAFNRFARLGLVAAAAIAVAACATPPEDPAARQAFEETNDPLEPMNRYFFDVNEAADELVVKPVATIYRDAIPMVYRQGVHNFLRNLRAPITILNSALQGDWDNTVASANSFFINTTAGLGGIFDIPGSFYGPTYREEDFGQTLGVWGVDGGPYLMLPLLGPSNARDTVGLGVDVATDPTTYLFAPAYSFAQSGAFAVSQRARNLDQIDELRRASVDFYATVRSLYRQQRESQIANGEVPTLELEIEDDSAYQLDDADDTGMAAGNATDDTQ